MISPTVSESFFDLAVFEADFTLNAFESILQKDSMLLKTFKEKALLRFHIASQRYSFHPLLKTYIQEKSKLTKALKDQHAIYYLNEVKRMTHSNQDIKNTAPKTLIAETQEILAAFAYAAKQNQLDLLYETVLPLMLFCNATAQMPKAGRVFEAALITTKDKRLKGKLSSSLAWVYFRQVEFDRSLEHASSGLKHLNANAELIEYTNCLLAQASVFSDKGDYAEALSSYEKIIVLSQTDLSLVDALGNQSTTYIALGCYEKAQENLKKALEIATRHNSLKRILWIKYLLLKKAFETNNYHKAAEDCEDLIQQALQFENHHCLKQANGLKVLLELAFGEAKEAQALAEMLVNEEEPNKPNYYAREGLAELAMMQGDYLKAFEVLKVALQITSKQDTPDLLKGLSLILKPLKQLNQEKAQCLAQQLNHEGNQKHMTHFDKEKLKKITPSSLKADEPQDLLSLMNEILDP